MDPRSDPDVQAMLALQQGDLAAFDQLFTRHIKGVVRYAVRFVGSQARAEELAQDVFLQLFKTRARYEPRARFKTWLFRMVSNACMSELRGADRRRRVDTPDGVVDDAVLARSSPDGFTSGRGAEGGELALLGREAVDKMVEAVDSLPPQQRAAVWLARAEGLSYDEVAESLGCSVSAVKSLIHRATVTLQATAAMSGVEE